MRNTPDGLDLACKHCRHRFPHDVTVGVLAAHFETEHDTTDVKLDLIVVCPRCDGEMDFEHQHGLKDYFGCKACRRTRVITRTPEVSGA